MKKIKALIIVLAVAILLLLTYRDYRERYDATDELYALVGTQKVELYDDGTYHLFLPSFADIDDIRLSDKASKLDIDVMKSSGLKSVFITTQSGNLKKIYADKEHSETADMVVIDADGHITFDDSIKSFKGHGNYTWYTEKWEKKAFGFKTSDNEKYTLFANATDATLIRNEIARQLEQTLGVRFAGSGEFVDLYINNEYQGNYYLVRNLEAAPDSIDILNIDKEVKDRAVTPEDITGGYLIEREFEVRFDQNYTDSVNGFKTDSSECFVIHSPKNVTEEENEYLRGYMNDVESAINSSYEEAQNRIDMNSFVLRFLSDEITKNYDAGVSSSYLYKDSDSVDPRLYYGPGWDFDMSMGNYEDWMTTCYNQPAGGLTLGQACEKSSYWYSKLYEYEPFREKVIAQYNEKAKPYLEYLVSDGIDEYRDFLKDSAAMDSIRWSAMYDTCGYRSNDDTEYLALKEFIRERTEFLNSEWKPN